MYKINDSLVEQNKKNLRSERRFFLCIVIILTLLLIFVSLSSFVYFNVRVSGQSMESTLYNDDILIANKLKTPKRGDVVIIKSKKGYWVIKRVIALEGDTVAIEGGSVYRNGNLLDEPYVKQQNVTGWDSNSFNDGKPYTLKEDEVFYLGDNRLNSSDSRDANNGVCKLSDVVGVVENWSISIKGFRNFIYSIPQKIAGLFK